MAKGNTEKMWKKAMGVTAFIVFVGFGAVLVSLFRWQIVRGEELSAKALNQSLHSTTLSAMRGTIYDATGTKVLAKSASVWTVVLEPNYFKDDDGKDNEALRRKVSSGLSRILDMDEETIYEKTGENSFFTYLKRRVESDVKDEVTAFLKENDIDNGVRLIDDYKRYYPYGTVASTILGFTGSDGQGLGGLELQYDSELRGTAGRMISAKNALGTDMPFEYEQLIGAENGYDLVLTIDETVQSILEKYLEQGIEQYQIKNGAVATMMNVNTGGILGLAVKGDYDPNDPFTIYDEEVRKEIDALPEDKQDEAYNNALQKQWRNKAVSDTYYPGSVFKMCVGAMGLEEGVITEESTFTCTGSMPVEGVTGGISCWKHAGHGLENFHDGLCNSCNPFFIHVGELLGAQTFAKYREAFGFTEQTGIDLPGESWSLYHSVEDLGPAELATESFGQNFSITPVQMITACAAVANGGYLMTPHVVDRVVDSEGNIVRKADTSYRRQVVSEETSKTISRILYDNATFGTASGGYVMGYRVCGKTGTSEKVAEFNADTSPDKKMKYIASYCGFAPVEKPQYALLVFFDEPDGDNNGNLTGGNAVAGPIFSAIMEEALPYLGIEAQYTDEEYETLDMVTPSAVGLTLEEAYRQLDELGLSYSVVGDESDSSILVTEQIPQVGENVPKGGKVVLYTNGYSEEDTLVEVPDFTSMDLSNANYAASLAGVQISVSGAGATEGGSASMQSVEPGTMVKKGTVITITFVENINTETFVPLG